MTKPRNPMHPLSQVEPQVLTWLWPGRLAEGKLALFDGDPSSATLAPSRVNGYEN